MSRKSRKLFGPEKPFVKFQTAHSVKLVFSYVIKAKQIKITATFRAPGRLRFEDTKKMMSPKIRLSCFLRLPCEASVPERRKNVYQTTRDVCSILFFGRQTGWEQRRGGEKETFPTLPYPYPYFHFSLSTRFLLLLFLFVFFFLCQKLKTWSLFALYSLEMLSTLSLSVICLLLVFEGCPSKPLYQSWLTTPFAKMTGVVSTIIL